MQKIKNYLSKISLPLASIVLALLLGGVIIRLLGFNPFLAYQSMFKGALSSQKAWGETLLKTVPLYLTGLSYAVARRCGMINIGAEGQLYIGGLTAGAVGIYLQGVHPVFHILLALLAGIAGGGLWGALSGWLKIKFGASEIITTIMLNYVAIFLVSYLVTGPMQEPNGQFPQSDQILMSARLPRILQGTRLHLGFIIALAAIAFYYFYLWRTTSGFEMRVVGMNPEAARYAGIRTERSSLMSMFFAGGFAGLAGAIEILGVQMRIFQNFSPNYGFDGIAVALLGQNTPIGILLSGFLFGILKSGANMMQMLAKVPISIVNTVQAIVILLVVGRNFFVFGKSSVQESGLGRIRQASEIKGEE